MEYVKFLRSNEIARKVKLADLDTTTIFHD